MVCPVQRAHLKDQRRQGPAGRWSSRGGARVWHKLFLLPSAWLMWKTRQVLSGVQGVPHILLKAWHQAREKKGAVGWGGECAREGSRRNTRFLRK